ncbi:MAG: TetM/TetW/TetO/TetS family tetracycline resistance ribosomal protection protein, partial [Oscillospiraceae bacterium]
MKRLVVGVLAHVDSGKTTLSEALLYACGAIKKTGRVDKGDTALDTDAIERDRGITVFSKLNFGDTQISLIDTPGHVDFSTEMERTLQVLDYAVLLVNGVDGIQNHTQTLWKLLEEHNIPTFIFVNKLDLNTANKDKIYLELRQKFSSACVDFKSGEDSGDFFEKLAVCDDNLFENFVANHSLQVSHIALAIKERKIFPCFFGSALKLIGTGEFLNELNKYTLGYEAKKDFGAKIFKISRDENGNRLTFMKITGGELRVKSLIEARDKNGKEWAEKPNQIRFYTGDKFILAQQAFAGDVCAVTGLNYTFPGQGLGVQEDYSGSFSQPVFMYSVKPSRENSIHTILSSLRILEEEDPQLGVSYDEPRGKINVQLMGKVQLEVLKSVMKNRFNIGISFDAGTIVYKETIENTVEGVGHFEPLRHYAEVHLLLQPLKSGAGLIFDSNCSEEVLGKSWQRLIMTHLQEKTHKGVLTASPITDMKITLMAGRASVDHTEGGDFREATYRSVRQGLMRAKSVLLEPWYQFVITVPTENIGRAMSDIQKMQGEFSMPTADGDSSVLQGKAPVSLLADYYQEITNYTKGKGRISLTLGGYFPCHNTDEV